MVLTKMLERQITPMKLLFWANLAASLIDIEVWPELLTASVELVISRASPKSLERSTGSSITVSLEITGDKLNGQRD